MRLSIKDLRVFFRECFKGKKPNKALKKAYTKYSKPNER